MMTIFTFLRGLFIIWLVLYALSRFGPPLHAATNDATSYQSCADYSDGISSSCARRLVTYVNSARAIRYRQHAKN